MKRAIIVVLALLLVLCACEKEKRVPTIEEVSEAVLSSLKDKGSFVLADEDFEESNFDLDEQTSEVRIYIDEGREIGIFKLESNSDAARVERGIRDYIAGEKESISSLLELYPSEELAARRSRYENAIVLSRNGYICYLVLEKNELETAKQAFLQLI